MEVPARRGRRSDEELLEQLHEQLAAVKRRQATRQMRKTPVIDAAVAAVLSLERAVIAAREAQDQGLLKKLQGARKPLAGYLLERGIMLPKPRRRKSNKREE